MSREAFELISLISSLYVLIPLSVLVYRFGTLSTLQRKLGWLLLTIFLVELISNALWYQQVNNLPLYHVYSLIEFWLIINIYRLILPALLNHFRVIIVGSIFTLLAVVNALFFQSPFEFNSNVTTISSIVFIFLSLGVFYSLMRENKLPSLTSLPSFWIGAGQLLYFSSNLLLFFISSRMEFSEIENYLLWGTHAVVNCILLTFYAFALWNRTQAESISK